MLNISENLCLAKFKNGAIAHVGLAATATKCDDDGKKV